MITTTLALINFYRALTEVRHHLCVQPGIEEREAKDPRLAVPGCWHLAFTGLPFQRLEVDLQCVSGLMTVHEGFEIRSLWH